MAVNQPGTPDEKHDDTLAVPTSYDGRPPDFHGPNGQRAIAALAIGSVVILSAIYAAQHLNIGGDGSARAQPVSTVVPASKGESTSDANVWLPNPTPLPSATSAQPPIARTTNSSAEVPPLQSTTRVAVIERSAPIAPPTTAPDTRMQIDPPPASQDAQAAHDLQDVQNGDTQGAQPRAALADDRETFAADSDRRVGYVDASSDDELWATTVIPCRLETAIDSQLPGVVRARVVQPVYDSHTHEHVVIPAGTLVQGEYDSHVIGGQTRLLVAWTRLYFPDGRKFAMGRQDGTDVQGMAGLDGVVDRHTGQTVRTGLLMTMLGVATQLLNPPASLLQYPSIGTQASQVAGANITQIGAQLAQQSLQIGPTIRLSPPYTFEIMLRQDLPLQRYEAS